MMRDLLLTIVGLALGIVLIFVILLPIFWLVDGCVGAGCK